MSNIFSDFSIKQEEGTTNPFDVFVDDPEQSYESTHTEPVIEALSEGRYHEDFILGSSPEVQSLIRTYNNVLIALEKLDAHVTEAIGSDNKETFTSKKKALATAMLPELNLLLEQINRVKFSASANAHNV